MFGRQLRPKLATLGHKIQSMDKVDIQEAGHTDGIHRKVTSPIIFSAKTDRLPGNPPSVFRSHSLETCDWRCWGSFDSEFSFDGVAVCNKSIVKTPPVEGIKETSPRDDEKVERSS